ncbi:MAG: repeat domain protein [Myxococcales bacterium]|nr:repeat domain protein [Myxococcales bacterium]
MSARPHRSHVFATLVAAALCVSGCNKVETTSVVVEVYSDTLTAGTDVDQVVASVKDGASVTFAMASPATAQTHDFPVRFSVTPSQSDTDVVAIQVVARLGAIDELTTGARVGFVKGETRLLRLRLDKACVRLTPACAAGTICVAGHCASDAVDVETLPRYVPSADAGPLPTTHADASVDRALDAPVDNDAASAADATVVDTASAAEARPEAVTEGGSVDAGCVDGASRDCSCGLMAGGHQTCVGQRWSVCAISCDATGIKGTCGPGTRSCDEAGAHWAACSIAPAAVDTCVPHNDDNCDGLENAGCTCVMGQTQTCDKSGLFGACAKGTQTCDVTGKWSACSIKPGLVDTCVAGNDDSCNGVVNEKCPCIDGRTRPCSDGGLFGKCAAGTQTCSQQAWGACSISAATADTCALGNDDNCNGKVNEGCLCAQGQTRTCAQGGLFGKCAAGAETCDATGKWGACSIAAAAADTCVLNNDDSCNGKVNEGCACVMGQARPCSDGGAKGKCAGGTQTCDAAGKWGGCSIGPAASDTCASGDDSTCNGVVNEGCACLDAQTRACSVGGAKGKCAGGTQTCGGGAWGACSVKN